MGKSDLGDVHSAPVGVLSSGQILKVRDGRPDLPGLIATGSMVGTAIDVANKLDLFVWSAPSIKPLDPQQICTAARASSGLVTLEEHSVYGGLGSVVAEILSEYEPVRVLRIGVADRFSEHCGTYAYLLTEHGLDQKTVMDRISQFLRLPPVMQAVS
jgi:transketolase